MEYFIKKATHLRENLAIWIEQFELPFDAFLEAGQNRLCDLQVGITREESSFADRIVDSKLVVPKDVIKAMCLGVAYLDDALEYFEKSPESALGYLICAAEEFGFCHGAYFGVGHVYASRRVAQSVNGKKGALLLHGPRTELKAWALSQAKGNRGSHKDIACALAAQIPKHLADISKDPERLIYDALRAQQKAELIREASHP